MVPQNKKPVDLKDQLLEKLSEIASVAANFGKELKYSDRNSGYSLVSSNAEDELKTLIPALMDASNLFLQAEMPEQALDYANRARIVAEQQKSFGRNSVQDDFRYMRLEAARSLGATAKSIAEKDLNPEEKLGCRVLASLIEAYYSVPQGSADPDLARVWRSCADKMVSAGKRETVKKVIKDMNDMLSEDEHSFFAGVKAVWDRIERIEKESAKRAERPARSQNAMPFRPTRMSM